MTLRHLFLAPHPRPERKYLPYPNLNSAWLWYAVRTCEAEVTIGRDKLAGRINWPSLPDDSALDAQVITLSQPHMHLRQAIRLWSAAGFVVLVALLMAAEYGWGW